MIYITEFSLCGNFGTDLHPVERLKDLDFPPESLATHTVRRDAAVRAGVLLVLPARREDPHHRQDQPFGARRAVRGARRARAAVTGPRARARKGHGRAPF